MRVVSLGPAHHGPVGGGWLRKEGSERGGKCPAAHSERTPELGLEFVSSSYGALGLPLPALLDTEGQHSPLELGPVLGAKGDRFHTQGSHQPWGVGCTNVQLPSLYLSRCLGRLPRTYRRQGVKAAPKT